jgi:pyruvate kinase
MRHSRAYIVATLGPTSNTAAVLREMVGGQLDVVRLNFSWGTLADHAAQIAIVRQVEREVGRRLPIIVDLPGPRIQEAHGHTYDRNESVLTEEDKVFIAFAVEHHVEYIAMSFVGSAADIAQCRLVITEHHSTQKIIAKIERAIALEHLVEIVGAADGIMVARGDLGDEVALEKIPFVQDRIVREAKKAGKPVIVATQMMLSMTDHDVPTRAEVTDVAYAILQGADAVMLSEETAKGAYPVAAVRMMEKIVSETEAHMGTTLNINRL